MPKRNITEISHSALTNHRIPARADEPISEPAPQPDKGGLVLMNPSQPERAIPKITLLKAYGQLASEHGEYQAKYLELLESVAKDQPDDSYVQAALGHKKLSEGKNEEALGLLVPALRLDQPGVQVDVAQALTNLGRAEEALPHWEAAASMDPYNPVLLKKLTLQYINLHQYVNAEKRMREYVEIFPEDKFMRDLLARVQTPR
jgi:tetratricopeptide (TPR) repeat protein